MIMQGFFRCDCGKMHVYAGVTQITRCACGRNLWLRLKADSVKAHRKSRV